MKKIVTKVDDMFKAWAKADDAARIEGVKRLGLPENNTALDRAKAMGFGDDVYHGTKADFDHFDSNRVGRANYVTPSHKIANLFSNTASQNGGSKVLPLKTRGNIFDYENPEHYAKLEKEIGPQIFGVKKGLWRDLEAKPVQEGIMKQGYDGFKVKETHSTPTNTGIYNPANIRSKFAHFNPKMAGIGAGSILSANLMADELDLEHKPKTSIWDSLMNTIGNVNQQQVQGYGDTAVNTATTIGNIVSDPSVAAELGIKGLRGTAAGLLLNSGSVEAAEDPNFLNKLQRQQ